MPDKLRVALLSSEYPPHIFGGLGTHVARLTAALSSSVTYELFVPEQEDYQNSDMSVHIHQIPASGAQTNTEYWLKYCAATASIVKRNGISVDLIHCHDWMTVLAGLELRQILGAPLIYNVHLPQTYPATRNLENFGLVNADLVIVNSQSVYNELTTRQLPIRQMSVVPNGVDLAEYFPSADWPLDDGYILFVGRLVAQKGVDLLLRAFGVLLHHCPDAHLVIVGEGDLELYLQRVASYLGFRHRVTFIPWQTGPALVDLFQKARLVVMPSYYEPFGIVALEAMACGRPVIASRVGGLPEIIMDGIQGYLTPNGDHLQLARRLADLMVNSKKRLQMGQAARLHSAQFSWREISQTILSMYQQLAGQAPAPPPAEMFNLGQTFLAGLEPPLRPVARSLIAGASPQNGSA
ncbi:MAG: glycosyltransferase family 4 protein [Anaerolineales bacterium]|nr:glycosyltransferase family 4 protein [Anaerolineales bacterium]